MLRICEDSFEWALKHLERYGDTDLFAVPFEYEAIRFRWEEIKAHLAAADLDEYPVRPCRRCLSPKSYYGFRIATQLDPLDTLLYTALVYETGSDIEGQRIGLDQQVVFGCRFDPDGEGRFFNPEAGHDAFLRQCRKPAGAAAYEYVVTADIADFFARIQPAAMEKALGRLSQKNHARAIGQLLRQWNQDVFCGLPAGQTASRLLAELLLSDPDRTLLANGIVYCRFSDDYRIFCKDRKEAYRALALLANTLFETVGLTLQPSKTRILSREVYCADYLDTDSVQEADGLFKKFRRILHEAGIENPYEEIRHEELTEDQQEAIDSLNLIELLGEQLGKQESMDFRLTRFLLRRLGQIGSPEGISLVLGNLEALYPLFKEVMRYLREPGRLGPEEKQKIGDALIRFLRNGSRAGQSDYHRSWAFNLFTHNPEWGNDEQFMGLYNAYPDEFSRRELILAMGRAGHDYWFKSNKNNLSQFRPWEKRAFLAAASCLPSEEAKDWYQANKASFDILESSVVEWARKNPF